jgi:hypothetical protein
MIKNYKVMPLTIKIDETQSASDVAKKLQDFINAHSGSKSEFIKFETVPVKVINSVDGTQASKEYTVCIFKEL